MDSDQHPNVSAPQVTKFVIRVIPRINEKPKPEGHLCLSDYGERSLGGPVGACPAPIHAAHEQLRIPMTTPCKKPAQLQGSNRCVLPKKAFCQWIHWIIPLIPQMEHDAILAKTTSMF